MPWLWVHTVSRPSSKTARAAEGPMEACIWYGRSYRADNVRAVSAGGMPSSGTGSNRGTPSTTGRLTRLFVVRRSNTSCGSGPPPRCQSAAVNKRSAAFTAAYSSAVATERKLPSRTT